MPFEDGTFFKAFTYIRKIKNISHGVVI